MNSYLNNVCAEAVKSGLESATVVHGKKGQTQGCGLNSSNITNLKRLERVPDLGPKIKNVLCPLTPAEGVIDLSRANAYTEEAQELGVDGVSQCFIPSQQGY